MTLAAAIATSLALLAVGLVLALRRLRRSESSAALAETVNEALLWQFVERGLQSWSVGAVARHLGETLAAGLGLGTVVLLEPSDEGWTAHRPEGPAPPPRQQNVFGWFRHNPDLVLASDLGEPRFGGMRLALEELCRQYGADALFPLSHRGQLFAVVCCGGLGRPLGEGERAFLRQIHLEAAALAANARLYTEAALKLSLQHEVAAARAVQEALVPKSRVERIGGVTLACHSRPAPEGPSDICLILGHEGRLTVVLGDVVGRGVAASIVAAVAKGCCETAPDADPATLLRLINSAIYRPGSRRPAMRCLAVSVEPEKKTTHIAGAGSPFPYLVRNREGRPLLESPIVRGPFLGDLPSLDPACVSVRLEPGDLLVLFTSGLVTAESVAGRQYGERSLTRGIRLAAGLPPEQFLGRLVDDLDRFVTDMPLRDDILLLVLQAD